MQFVYPALTWGFLLALVPLLIHLINLLRHRRVAWAAMEFVLASYRKHRTWVWLKQLLLLAARMAAIVLVVAMVAQPKTRDQWLVLFGGRVTHHYVLLDDSYSMSDRVAGESAFDAARRVIGGIVGRAAQEDSPQRLTLLRYSQARPTGDQALPPAAEVADFNAQPLDAQFDLALERKLRPLEPTALAVGPGDALTLLRQLLAASRDETALVYLLSDFRVKDWDRPAEVRDLLSQLRRMGAELHLVDCSRSREPNLGIVALQPANDTRAANVPLFVHVQVKNHGTRPVTRVPLKVHATACPADEAARLPLSAVDQFAGQTEEVATLLLDQIGPGETVERRVQVYFAQPGRHIVQASLPEDPVEADNRRWCVIDMPAGEPVLIVDGSPQQQHAYFLQAAFRPLERSNTGIRPDVRPLAMLRDATLPTLQQYAAIYLLDVPRLDGSAAQTLQSYVEAGGGLAIFVGPSVQNRYYNEVLYREGQGLLPAPLGLDASLPLAVDPEAADLELTTHPLFAFFQSETNPLIRGVKLDRYRRLADGFRPSEPGRLEVLAWTRDKQPLVLEKRLGQGTVLLFLTTLAPDWNDWAKNPSFVVMALKMQAYLAASRHHDDPRLVGTPLVVTLESSQYLPDVVFVTPGASRDGRQKIERTAQPAQADSLQGVAVLQRRAGEAGWRGETDRPGVYEAWLRTVKGQTEVRRWAFNVEPAEGDLRTLPAAELLARLDPVKVNYHQAEHYRQDEVASSGYNLSLLVLAGLVLLLVGEQWLGYRASYHIPAGGGR
jgi:hypothetical protein